MAIYYRHRGGGVPRLYIVCSKVGQKSNRTAVRSDVVSVSRQNIASHHHRSHLCLYGIGPERGEGGRKGGGGYIAPKVDECSVKSARVGARFAAGDVLMLNM